MSNNQNATQVEEFDSGLLQDGHVNRKIVGLDDECHLSDRRHVNQSPLNSDCDIIKFEETSS